MTTVTPIGIVTTDADGSISVVFDRVYRTDPADLWDAVTDAERIARWFAPVDGELREGGRFAVRFDDGDVADCRVLACDAPRSFTWEWPHGDRASHIRVEVLAAGGDARLRLTHTRLSIEAAPGYAAGWDVYVNRLGDYLSVREVRDTWFEDWPRARDAYATRLAQGDGQAEVRP